MITRVSSLLFCIVLLSCQDNKEKKIKDFEEIVPKSSSSRNASSENSSLEIDTQKINYFSSLKNLKLDSVVEFKQNLIPDRFNPTSRKKENLYYLGDSIQFLVWNYKDSIQTKRALYNLMDCFENPCRPFKLYESKNVSKGAFIICSNPRKLVIVKSSKNLNLSDWLKFLSKKNISSSFDVIIEQQKNAKTIWWEIKKGKLKNIKPKL